ncbi:MAG: hypothetical protein L3J05_07270, partial [Robiginitomaculum sp.]|nr:hypothetical protein [Robiginitomaculum sp.]
SFRKDVHEYLSQPGMVAGISDPYEAFEAGIYSDYTKGAWGYFKGGASCVGFCVNKTLAIKSLKRPHITSRAERFAQNFSAEPKHCKCYKT